jgi:hypothetical protein
MGTNKQKQLACFVVLLFLASGAFARPGTGSSLLSLPERLAYKVLSVPGKVAQTVLPRTTSNVKTYTVSARRTGARAVATVENTGKQAASTVGKVVTGTLNLVSSAAKSVGSTAVSILRAR